jgi:hypothetical protein
MLMMLDEEELRCTVAAIKDRLTEQRKHYAWQIDQGYRWPPEDFDIPLLETLETKYQDALRAVRDMGA